MTPEETAKLALMTLAAEDMFTDPKVTKPALDPRLVNDGWKLLGHLTAVDAWLRPLAKFLHLAQRVYFGFAAWRGEEAVVVVRGTQGMLEWGEDAEYKRIPHPQSLGEVEAGFYGLYQTMQFDAGMWGAPDVWAIPLSIANNLGWCSRITVIGHSLGAAIAHYLAVDMALKNPDRKVAGRFFASPRPGDLAFATAANLALPDHYTYAYSPDAVPRVPTLEMGYAHLPALIEISENPGLIKPGVWCSHHAFTYATLIHKPTADAWALTTKDADYPKCVIG